MKHEMCAYWPTRIMLAAAFLPPVAVALLWLATPQFMGGPVDPMGRDGPVFTAVGGALWLVGLVWMVRIFRGPREEPPAWRYRDR